MGWSRRLAWMGVLAFVLTAAAASAQDAEESGAEGSNAHDQEARALYQAGRVAFDDGRFDDALGYFERAHELSGRPQLLFNIASAADRLRRNAVALEHFEAYLAAVPDADNRRSVEARIALLRDALEHGREHGTEQTTVPTPEETAAAGMEGTDTTGGNEPTTESSRTGLWVGIGVGAAVLVGLAIVLAVVLRDPDPDYQPSDEGILVFALESP